MFSADNNTSPELIFAIQQDGDKIQTRGGMTFLVHAQVGGSMNAGDFGIDGGWWGLRTKPTIAALYPTAGPSQPRQAFVVLRVQRLLGQRDEPDRLHHRHRVAKVHERHIDRREGQELDLRGHRFPGLPAGRRVPDLRRGDAARRRRGRGHRRWRTSTRCVTGPMATPRARSPTRSSPRRSSSMSVRASCSGEGTRRTDLIRYGQFSTAGVWQWKGGTAAARVTEAFRDLYPLPASELIANPKLKQNPGVLVLRGTKRPVRGPASGRAFVSALLCAACAAACGGADGSGACGRHRATGPARPGASLTALREEPPRATRLCSSSRGTGPMSAPSAGVRSARRVPRRTGESAAGAQHRRRAPVVRGVRSGELLH